MLIFFSYFLCHISSHKTGKDSNCRVPFLELNSWEKYALLEFVRLENMAFELRFQCRCDYGSCTCDYVSLSCDYFSFFLFLFFKTNETSKWFHCPENSRAVAVFNMEVFNNSQMSFWLSKKSFFFKHFTKMFFAKFSPIAVEAFPKIGGHKIQFLQCANRNIVGL